VTPAGLAALDLIQGDADAPADAGAAQLARQAHLVDLLAACGQQFRRLFHAAGLPIVGFN
jgi:hypothetical protein